MDKVDEVTKHYHARLDDGRYVQFYVNTETNLLVVDVVSADEASGVEVFRRIV